MPRLRAPGAYFEPADPPPRRIAEVRTDVTGFVGVADRGPLHVPVRVESWAQFVTRFGGHTRQGFLAYAVKGFFANGGRRSWVVRVGAAAPEAPRASALLANRAGAAVFEVVARDHGPGAEALTVRVEPAAGKRFSLFVEMDGRVLEVWRDLDAVPGQYRYAPDVVNGRTMGGAQEGQPDEAERTELGSVLIEIVSANDAPGDRLPVGVLPARRATRRRATEDADPPGTERVVFGTAEPRGPVGRSGFLGSAVRAVPVLAGLTVEHFTGEDQPPGRLWGLKALERVDEVALVAVPDLLWPGYPPPGPPPTSPPHCRVVPAGGPAPEPPEPVRDERTGLTVGDAASGQSAVVRHCAAMRDRFAVLDVPAGFDPQAAVEWAAGKPGTDARPGLRSEAGQFAALYYPWVLAPDPLPGPAVRLVPPSGHVAGMFARVDRLAGVQKAPANEVLEEVRGVERDLDAAAHARLNDEGVNAVRTYPGRGVRVAGARTLVPPTDPSLRQWRYVQVRRLMLMFEEAIDQSAQWVVFEDNRAERWREVDRVVRTFLDDQWRRGRLDGATADEAYQVTCDETTNSRESADAGQFVCEIAVRPPMPAEFVIVRIGRRVGETGTVDFRGGGRDA